MRGCRGSGRSTQVTGASQQEVRAGDVPGTQQQATAAASEGTGGGVRHGGSEGDGEERHATQQQDLLTLLKRIPAKAPTPTLRWIPRRLEQRVGAVFSGLRREVWTAEQTHQPADVKESAHRLLRARGMLILRLPQGIGDTQVDKPKADASLRDIVTGRLQLAEAGCWSELVREYLLELEGLQVAVLA